LGGFFFLAFFGDGVGVAFAAAGAVVEVPVVPCCWQEAMNAIPMMAAIIHSRCLFIDC
jgi:hypothetical protein